MKSSFPCRRESRHGRGRSGWLPACAGMTALALLLPPALAQDKTIDPPELQKARAEGLKKRAARVYHATSRSTSTPTTSTITSPRTSRRR